MKHFTTLVFALALNIASSETPDPKVLLQEPFSMELSKDWFWGLGTWKAENGILRGFESGPRRHGPVKMRRLVFKDATLECEFRLEGKAAFAGIIFNGSQERGHLVHLVMGTKELRVLVHPNKGENKELLKIPAGLAVGAWHRVKIGFHGETLTATVDGQTISAMHPSIAEEKQTFGLGGDSGGPQGVKAGALEFRGLRVTQP